MRILLITLGIALHLTSFAQYKPIIKDIRDDSAQYATIIRPPEILFNLDKVELDHPSNPMDSIKIIADFIKKHPDMTFEVSNHSDYRCCPPQYSIRYSFRRAKNIVDALITHFGVDPERVVPAGYNDSRARYLEKAVTTPSGRIIPAGTYLTEKWIDMNFLKKANKDDFEFVMALNRRTEIRVLRKDYKPRLSFTLKGKVINKLTNEPLEGATINLVGSDISSIQTKTDSLGNYFFDWINVRPDVNYIVQAKYYPIPEGLDGTHWGLLPLSKISTKELKEPKDFIVDFGLYPPPPTVHLPTVYFSKNSDKIKDANKDSVELLYKIMVQNPNIVIGLDGYKSYGEHEEIFINRVQSVIDYLKAKGIPGERLATDWEGKKFFEGFSQKQNKKDAIASRKVTFQIIRADYVPR